MADLLTDFSGRIRNFTLAEYRGIYALYEAVVNSIQSIDERIEKDSSFNIDQSVIRIKLIRESQCTIDDTKSELRGFEVLDNGIGFDSNNFKSFHTLDSSYKIAKGGRGVGRLAWLKVFNRVNIESVFVEKDEKLKRQFTFSIQNGIQDENVQSMPNDIPNETKVSLLDINRNYKRSIPKTVNALASSLLEHCIWYFMRDGGAPKIEIIDGLDVITLSELYDSTIENRAQIDEFNIGENVFYITHVKSSKASDFTEKISYCADNRLVLSESVSDKIKGFFGILEDETTTFHYSCYITGEYLNQNITQDRQDFTFSKVNDQLFPDQISLEDIRNAALVNIQAYLDPYLVDGKEKGRKKLEDFVNHTAPKYRKLLAHMSDDDKIVHPAISDRELELKMHREYSKLEESVLKEGQELRAQISIQNKDEYQERFNKYIEKAKDLHSTDLANYVVHRKVILDLLDKAIHPEDGLPVREEIIHRLLMPMVAESDSVDFDENNLWVINERLVFHDYMASDKPISSMPISNSESRKEPDILSLSVFDNPLLVNNAQNPPLASITVVEFKRPLRNDMTEGSDKNPIEQALLYLNNIRDGGVKTKLNRPIPQSRDIPGFCYVVCDLTETMINRCKLYSLHPTADHMGYFGYNENYKAYIEVISYDLLLTAARERNNAFFTKLGLPIT